MLHCFEAKITLYNSYIIQEVQNELSNGSKHLGNSFKTDLE